MVVGGDGSILQAVYRMGRRQRPVVGVNLGKLGFLADLSPDEVCSHLAHICSGELPIIKKNWESAIGVRLEFGPNTAVWHTEFGKVNTFQHIWPYQSLDQREEIRKKAQATGLWPAGKKAIKEGGRDYNLIQQENKIVMPSDFSPLQ